MVDTGTLTVRVPPNDIENVIGIRWPAEIEEGTTDSVVFRTFQLVSDVTVMMETQDGQTAFAGATSTEVVLPSADPSLRRVVVMAVDNDIVDFTRMATIIVKQPDVMPPLMFYSLNDEEFIADGDPRLELLIVDNDAYNITKHTQHLSLIHI